MWVLLVVPMLVLPLGFAILNGPSLARTFAGSLRAQLHAAVTQLGHADIAAGLLTVISTVLLVLPMAGLSYILLRTVKSTFRQVLAVTRRRPALRLLAVAVTLLVAAGLAAHWGVLPSRGRGAALRPSQAGRVTVERPDLAPPAAGRPSRPAFVLQPVGAAGFDALEGLRRTRATRTAPPSGTPSTAIPATAWPTQYYLGSPVLGVPKKGSGVRANRLRGLSHGPFCLMERCR